MDRFARVFAIIVGEEGGYSAEPEDAGNWTGGAPGAGLLRGTKYGISAAAYPELDIQALTLEDARALYRRDYWAPVAGDALPPALALVVFDAAVNNGVARAARWLQAALGVAEDGAIGPVTIAAAGAADPAATAAEFLARRLVFMAALAAWREFGLGWARRLCGLPFKAASLAA